MQNQKGSALVLVMLTVAALLIVGVSLVAASTVEYRSSVNHGHSTQAFFVAEAGLNWARRGLQSGTIVLPTGLSVGQTHTVYRSQGFGGTSTALSSVGELDIAFTRTASGWDLVAQGAQHQARRTVSIQVTEQAGAGGGSLDRHHVSGSVSVSGSATVTGNINASSWDANSASRVTGTLNHVPTTNFLFPAVSMPLPNGLTPQSNFSTTKDNTPVFPGAGHYHTFAVHDRLDINVPSSADVVIRVMYLNVASKGDIRIVGSGTGRVIFHVDHSVNLDGQASINSGGLSARLSIFHHGSQNIALTGQQVIGGSLITNTASIAISGNAAITGHILTNSNSVMIGKAEDNGKGKKKGSTTPPGQVIYAPNAVLDMRGNDFWTGVVVVRQLIAGGSSDLVLNASLVSSFDPFAANVRQYTFSNWNVRR